MLLDALLICYEDEYEDSSVTNTGSWLMELTNTEGVTYSRKGQFDVNFEYEIDISDLIRAALGMDDLYLFDGYIEPDRINRIALDYHRTIESHDYTERLLIDRETKTLEFIQTNGTGYQVSHKYTINGVIQSLLDRFDATTLFAHIEGNADDVIETPSATSHYTITVDYKKNPQRVVAGTFDKNGLPDDFKVFAEAVLYYMKYYGSGQILDSSIYSKAKRRKSDYILCSVRFDYGYQSYYYLTEDDSIEVGDMIVVPAGRDNHHAVVEVVAINYFGEAELPLPLTKIKYIIRKLAKDGT